MVLTDEELAEIREHAVAASDVVHEEYYPTQQADEAIDFFEKDLPRLMDELERLQPRDEYGCRCTCGRGIGNPGHPVFRAKRSDLCSIRTVTRSPSRARSSADSRI